MGSKPKFWFRQGDENWLYKQVRPGTGEDWAEKVSECLCELLGLPHTRYELASWGGVPGVVSQSFLPKGGALVHGNELLFQLAPDYPRGRKGSRSFYRVPQHTVDLVLNVISSPRVNVPLGWSIAPGIELASDVFCGYLMLDAWIGNTDRHHENWALMVEMERPASFSIRLAPSFDHASGLACHIKDDEREERLSTKDRGRSIEVFAARARSALYASPGDNKPLTTIQAFNEAARRRPHAANAWLERLENVQSESVASLLSMVPGERMTDSARAFTRRFLELNRTRLLALRESLL
jgi:hypothetical protein